MKIGLQIFENESSEHVCFQILFFKMWKKIFFLQSFLKVTYFQKMFSKIFLENMLMSRLDTLLVFYF